MRKLILSGLIFLSIGCKGKVEFHKLSIDVSMEILQQEKHSNINYFVEYFVIANAPEDYTELRTKIDAFNNNTPFLPANLEKYRYVRIFYRETSFTPRNYTELSRNRGYFGGDDTIEVHFKDLLLNQTWTKNKCKMSIARSFYKNEKELNKYSDFIMKDLKCKKSLQ